MLLIILSVRAYAEKDYTGEYIWNEVVLMAPSQLDGTAVIGNSPLPVLSKVGQKFRVVNNTVIGSDTVAIIYILDYTVSDLSQRLTSRKSTTDKKYSATSSFYKYNFSGDPATFNALPAEEVNSKNYKELQKYFKIPLKVLKKYAKRNTRIGASLAIGVINFPFKLRLQNNFNDFSGSFNLGAGIGLSIAHRNWRRFEYSIISGYSISNINLEANAVRRNQENLASTNNFTAFSFSLGILGQNDKAQVGLFIGIDQLSNINQKEYGWRYQGKPWFSIGFGYAIFSTEIEKAEKGADNEQ